MGPSRPKNSYNLGHFGIRLPVIYLAFDCLEPLEFFIDWESCKFFHMSFELEIGQFFIQCSKPINQSWFDHPSFLSRSGTFLLIGSFIEWNLAITLATSSLTSVMYKPFIGNGSRPTNSSIRSVSKAPNNFGTIPLLERSYKLKCVFMFVRRLHSLNEYNEVLTNSIASI